MILTTLIRPKIEIINVQIRNVMRSRKSSTECGIGRWVMSCRISEVNIVVVQESNWTHVSRISGPWNDHFHTKIAVLVCIIKEIFVFQRRRCR